jgi:hypothetical protein
MRRWFTHPTIRSSLAALQRAAGRIAGEPVREEMVYG